MIIVDVRVPALDAVYDFSLSEDTYIGILIEEMVEMICRHEKLLEAPDSDAHWLCCVSTGQILDREKTLHDYGVETGNQLILV